MRSCILSLLARLACAGCSLPSTDLYTQKNTRVVVIPDTHGDYLATLTSLHIAYTQIEEDKSSLVPFSEFRSIFDAIVSSNKYPDHPIPTAPSGSVILVQMGDMVDRGPDSKAVVEVFSNLHFVLGWTVRVLYGNHEIMSLLGEGQRYVHPRDLIRMCWPRVAAGRNFNAGITKMAVGMVRVSALPGVNGRLSLTHPRNPNTLFVHAGIDLRWHKGFRDHQTMQGINEVIQTLVNSPYGLGQLDMPHSPMWTRQLSENDEKFVCGEPLARILYYFKVSRIVVAHSPQDDMQVKTRCGGRILLTDVKMSRWMSHEFVDEASSGGGRPVAVIMSMGVDGLLDSIVAHYTDLKTRTRDEQTIIFPREGHLVGPYVPAITRRFPAWRDEEVRDWEERHNITRTETTPSPADEPVSDAGYAYGVTLDDVVVLKEVVDNDMRIGTETTSMSSDNVGGCTSESTASPTPR